MITKINSTTGNFTFNPTLNQTDSSSIASFASSSDLDLCSNLDLRFIDDIGKALNRIMHWGIGLLVLVGCVVSFRLRL